MKGLKAFGELNLDEKIELFTHWADGGDIEFWDWSDRRWVKSIAPLAWISQIIYRKVQTKPSINWDHVSDDFNWLVVDSFGNGYLFRRKPVQLEKSWSCSDVSAKNFKSYNRGNCEWAESLVMRPDYKGE